MADILGVTSRVPAGSLPEYARMGVDSIAAVVIHLVGIAGLATIAT
ncbi:hypothetical protein ACWC4J_27330 [Streptomyces sp. NPDC001356]